MIAQNSDFVEESRDMSDDSVEFDLRVIAGMDVTMMVSEIGVVVSVVVAQYFPLIGVVILEPVKPPARVVAIDDSEHLDSATGDGSVQLEGVAGRHPLLLCSMRS